MTPTPDFLKYQIKFVITFFTTFFFNCKIIYPVDRLYGYRVSVVNDCADTVLVQSMTMLRPCQRSQRLKGIRFFANTKNFAKPFRLFRMGPGRVFFYQQIFLKPRDTVPLSPSFNKLREAILNPSFDKLRVAL